MFIPNTAIAANQVETGSWTPTLTATPDPTLGSGSIQSGRYVKYGRLVFFWGFIKFGTSDVAQGTGNYRISSLPFSFSASMQDGTNSDTGNPILGQLSVWDDSAQVSRHGFVGRWVTEDSQLVGLIDSAATANLFLGVGQPWAWAASDHIQVNGVYETDE